MKLYQRYTLTTNIIFRKIVKIGTYKIFLSFNIIVFNIHMEIYKSSFDVHKELLNISWSVSSNSLPYLKVIKIKTKDERRQYSILIV